MCERESNSTFLRQVVWRLCASKKRSGINFHDQKLANQIELCKASQPSSAHCGAATPTSRRRKYPGVSLPSLMIMSVDVVKGGAKRREELGRLSRPAHKKKNRIHLVTMQKSDRKKEETHTTA